MREASETPAGESPYRAWYERAIPFAVGLAPLVSALAHLRATSDGTHDEGVIRVIGLGSTGIWRSIDALLGMPALALPWSTNVARAEIVSALGAGVAALLLYDVGRRLLEKCASTTWLGILVAAIAAWTATLGAAWQTEACAVGGATWGRALRIRFARSFGFPRGRDSLPSRSCAFYTLSVGGLGMRRRAFV